MMLNRMRSPSKGGSHQRGQALVEFALVVPIFLILVLGIVDFGWALRSWITVTNSAREGARRGAVGATCDQIKQRAVDTSAGLLSTSDVSVTNCQGQHGTPLVVTVTYGYDFITPLKGFIGALTRHDCGQKCTGVASGVKADLCICSTTNMRIE